MANTVIKVYSVNHRMEADNVLKVRSEIVAKRCLSFGIGERVFAL